MKNTPDHNLMEQIASNEILEQAFEWLCCRRKEYSHNNDIWDLRRRWKEVKPELQADLTAGRYRLSAQQQIRKEDTNIELWSSQDALVLKAASIVLAQRLKPDLSMHCYHISGNGGAKAAIRKVFKRLRGNNFVFRTDVKRYYASIDHRILFDQLQLYISDFKVLALLKDYLNRVIYYGGLYWDIKRGISLGCSLSPLMGALYLKELDDRMAKTGLFYARFMDDWVILASKKWKLRAAIKIVNQILDQLKLEKHPDKTFIGKIEKGFDFLGYTFGTRGLGIARKTRMNFVDRITLLYEQGADTSRIGQYIRHWSKWATSGVPALKYNFHYGAGAHPRKRLTGCGDQPATAREGF